MELEWINFLPVAAMAIGMFCGFGIGWEVTIPAAADEVGWVMLCVTLVIPMLMLISETMDLLVPYYFLDVVILGFVGGVFSEMNQKRLKLKYTAV